MLITFVLLPFPTIAARVQLQESNCQSLALLPRCSLVINKHYDVDQMMTSKKTELLNS